MSDLEFSLVLLQMPPDRKGNTPAVLLSQRHHPCPTDSSSPGSRCCRGAGLELSHSRNSQLHQSELYFRLDLIYGIYCTKEMKSNHQPRPVCRQKEEMKFTENQSPCVLCPNVCAKSFKTGNSRQLDMGKSSTRLDRRGDVYLDLPRCTL